MARRIRSRVFGSTRTCPLSARETVLTETPALFATCFSPTFITRSLRFYERINLESSHRGLRVRKTQLYYTLTLMLCQRILFMDCAKNDIFFHGALAPLIHVNVRLLPDLCTLAVESSNRFGLNSRLINLDFSWQRPPLPFRSNESGRPTQTTRDSF